MADNSNQIDISLNLMSKESADIFSKMIPALNAFTLSVRNLGKHFEARGAAQGDLNLADSFGQTSYADEAQRQERQASENRRTYDSTANASSGQATQERATQYERVEEEARGRLSEHATRGSRLSEHATQGLFNTFMHRGIGAHPIAGTVIGAVMSHPHASEVLGTIKQGPGALGARLDQIPGVGNTVHYVDREGNVVTSQGSPDSPDELLAGLGAQVKMMSGYSTYKQYLGSDEARQQTDDALNKIPLIAGLSRTAGVRPSTALSVASKAGLAIAAAKVGDRMVAPFRGMQEAGTQDLGYARSGSADLTIPGTGLGFEVPFLGQLIQPGTWQHISDVMHEKLIAMQAGISGKQAKEIMENVESRGFIDNSDAKSRQLEGMVDIAKQVPGLDTGLTGTMMDESTRYGAESVGNFVAQMKRLPDAAHAANISLQTMHAQLQDFAGQMGQYGFTTAQSVSMGITGTQAFGTPLPVWSKLMSHPMTTGTMMGQTGLLPSQFGLAGPQAMQGAALQGFSTMVNMFHLSDRNVKDQFGVSHFISGKDAAINQAAQMYGLTPDQARAMYNHATTSKTFLGMSDWADTYAGNIAQQQKEGHMGQARAMLASSGSQIQKLLSDPNSGIAKGSSEYNEIEKALKQKGDPYTVAAARQKAINDAMNKQDKSWNNQQVQGQTVHVGFTGLAEKVLKQIIQPGGGFNSNPAHDIAKVGIDLADPVSGAADAFDAGKKILGSIGL